jgi:hypothetical protein
LNEDCSDDELSDASSLETDFDQFVDMWVEILDETDEFLDIEKENSEMFSLEIEDIIYPVIDSNAK